jgi:hypothetical protein
VGLDASAIEFRRAGHFALTYRGSETDPSRTEPAAIDLLSQQTWPGGFSYLSSESSAE